MTTPETNDETVLATWRTPERIRESLQHIADFLPTALIRRGDRSVAELPLAPTPLRDLVVSADYGTITDAHARTETDAWLVLHGGRIVEEQYFTPMTADTRHLLMSVSKSMTSIIVGALVDQGALATSEQVTTYLPELADSGYAGATLRDVLDMRTGVRYSEDYFDPDSDDALHNEAIGWAPHHHGGPLGQRQLLRGLTADRPHGGYFEYRSCETAVLGWVCEAVTGKPFADLTAELLWSRLGAEADASFCVDPGGSAMPDRGIVATARDVARFGMTVLNGGITPAGERVVSRAWIDDLFAPSDELTAAFASGPDADYLPGGRYRSQFWVPADGETASCVGIHGQFIYIDRTADMVGVKLSSWPVPLDPERIMITRLMFATVADHLRSR
ncbi:serine hydrolase [Nocardia sp. NPDC050378]|uniref:serine hydrolase domain-containing protein n=1 Tax=Nocardia sp. NPDC050378 TaxID=3155400 RepID=UPI0033CD262A